MKLISTREHGSPVMLQGKTVGIEMTGDITNASWVSVVPPCAPNVIRLLIDGKVAMTSASCLTRDTLAPWAQLLSPKSVCSSGYRARASFCLVLSSSSRSTDKVYGTGTLNFKSCRGIGDFNPTFSSIVNLQLQSLK